MRKMSRTLIGYGYTNSQGIATLDHDANDQSIEGYVGEGAGVLNIKAEYDELSSLPLEIYDVEFLDRATETDYTTWFNQQGITVTRNANDTTIEQTTSTTTGFYRCNFNDDHVAEFDIYIENSTGNQISIRDESGDLGNLFQQDLSNIGIPLNSYVHVKVELKSLSLKVYVDNVNTYSTSLSRAPNRFMFRLGSGTPINYKNFMVYPI